MIVWRGKGIFTLFIFLGCMFGIPVLWRLAHGVHDPALLKATHYDDLFAAAMMIAGAALIGCGFYFNRNPDQLVVDRRNGRTVRAGRQHTFMYLAMEGWGGIALLGGLWLLIKYWGQPVA